MRMNFVKKFVLVWLIFDSGSVLNAAPLGVRNFEGVAQVDLEVSYYFNTIFAFTFVNLL